MRPVDAKGAKLGIVGTNFKLPIVSHEEAIPLDGYPKMH